VGKGSEELERQRLYDEKFWIQGRRDVSPEMHLR